MYTAILNHLCCPICRRNFDLRAHASIDGDVIEGLLTCEAGHSFGIHRGVADFNSEEQTVANQWETLSQEKSFEEFDREIDGQYPAEVLERREDVLDAIGDAVSDHDPKFMLDIASGRGLLLTELTKVLRNDVHIVSTDLSPFVLEYDYQKFKKLAPNMKISYLACNAANLPLKDNVMDAAASYGGFSNMIGCAGEALSEAHRVVKPAGILVDSYVVIEEESKGFDILRQVCSEQQLFGAEEFFLSDCVRKHHEDLFSHVGCNVVFEGIGVGNDMDLLPYDGEWYAEQVFVSRK